MNRLLTVVLIASFFSVGSSLRAQDDTKAASASPGTVTAIFYRYRAYVGSARRATINVDGKQICSLVNGRFYKVEIPAGTHLITGPDKRKGAEVVMEAGKTYYFHAVLNMTGAFQVHNIFTVVPVPVEQGDFEIKSLKPLDPADVTPQKTPSVKSFNPTDILQFAMSLGCH